LELRLNTSKGRLLATIIPDPDWPKMYRVQMPSRDLTNTVNLTRAKDAARSLALADLNVAKTHPAAVAQ
jgi:hypothetical protein